MDVEKRYDGVVARRRYCNSNPDLSRCDSAMRISKSLALLLSAFSAYFLTTDSYVLSPERSHRKVASKSTNINDLRLSKCKVNGCSAIDRRFQLQCNRDESPWSDQLLSKFRKPFIGLLAAVSFFVMGARNSVARPPKTSKSVGSALKTSVIQNKKERQTSTKQLKKAVEVELVVRKNSITSSQLSRVGFVLVGVSTIATLLTGDEKKKKMKVVKKQVYKEPSRPAVTLDDDEEEEFSEPVRLVNRKINIAPSVEKTLASPKKVRKGLSAMNSLPPQEDLFSQGDEADNFFEVSVEDLNSIKDEAPSPAASKKKPNKFSLPPSAPKMDIKSSRIVVDESFAVPEVQITPTASIPLPPPPPPAKKGIFDRIFQKRSTSRPTDIVEVLRAQDAASGFRAATATMLTAYLPRGSRLFPDIEVGGMLSFPVDEETLYGSEEKRVLMLSSLIGDLGLQSKEAAEAFADITNAMLVTLTDNCVDLLDRNGKISEDAEKPIGIALDTLTDFAISAAALFGLLLPGMIIEDGGIKYNGKAQRSKLETLFSGLIKDGMDMSAFTKMMTEEAEPDPNAQIDAEKRSGRAQCLQHIFCISEGKRVSLEQKAMKDMIMTMVGGESGMSDLAGMLGNMGGIGGMGGGLGGEGGVNPTPEEAAEYQRLLQEEMKKAGQDIDPRGLEKMSEDLMGQLGFMRQALRDGSVTRENVIELEQNIGISMDEMLNLSNAATKMPGSPSELAEMIALFKQLIAIKNK